MKAFTTLLAWLYLLTALATARQLGELIMWGVWGRQPQTVEYFALLAAFVLFFGAAAMFGGNPLGNRIAVAASAVLWAFYAPAVWYMVGAATTRPDRQYDLLGLVPPALLLLANVFGLAHLYLLRKRRYEPTEGRPHG